MKGAERNIKGPPVADIMIYQSSGLFSETFGPRQGFCAELGLKARMSFFQVCAVPFGCNWSTMRAWTECANYQQALPFIFLLYHSCDTRPIACLRGCASNQLHLNTSIIAVWLLLASPDWVSMVPTLHLSTFSYHLIMIPPKPSEPTTSSHTHTHTAIQTFTHSPQPCIVLPSQPLPLLLELLLKTSVSQTY